MSRSEPSKGREEKMQVPGTEPTSSYETSEVHVRTMLWFVAGFIVSMAVILTALWWIQKPLTPHNLGDSRPPRAPVLEQPLQPSPGHETLDWQDLAAMRDRQQKQLESYGPIAGDPAHAHIPIDRAMDLLLNHGELQQSWTLPTTPPYKMETQPSPYVKPTVRNRT